MNWFADENVDQAIVEALRGAGHRVQYAAEIAPAAPDEFVLAAATQANAVMLTADKDFGALVFHQRRVTAGVVLLRLAGLTPQQKAERVVAFARDHGHEIEGAFTVVTSTSLRFRLTP